jgi:hypothetical protein
MGAAWIFQSGPYGYHEMVKLLPIGDTTQQIFGNGVTIYKDINTGIYTAVAGSISNIEFNNVGFSGISSYGSIICYQYNPAAKTWTNVGEFSPNNLVAVYDANSMGSIPGGLYFGGSICNDGTNIYVSALNEPNQQLGFGAVWEYTYSVPSVTLNNGIVVANTLTDGYGGSITGGSVYANTIYGQVVNGQNVTDAIGANLMSNGNFSTWNFNLKNGIYSGLTLTDGGSYSIGASLLTTMIFPNTTITNGQLLSIHCTNNLVYTSSSLITNISSGTTSCLMVNSNVRTNQNSKFDLVIYNPGPDVTDQTVTVTALVINSKYVDFL